MFELVKTSSHTWFKQSVNSNLCCWSPHFPYKTDSLFKFYYPSWINQPIKYPLSHTSPKQNETHDMNIWFKLFYFFFYFYYFSIFLFTPSFLILLLHHYECDLVSACLTLVPRSIRPFYIYIYFGQAKAINSNNTKSWVIKLVVLWMERRQFGLYDWR